MDEVLKIADPLLSNDAVRFIVIVLVLIYGQAQIFSEKHAEKFGLIGLVGRKLKEARQVSLEKDRAISERQVEDLKKEIRRVDEARQHDVRELQKHLDDTRGSERAKHDYIVWLTKVMYNLEVWAASKGLSLPPPPFYTFQQWMENGSPADVDVFKPD